ncbi:MAG TPA: hypothetical protein PLK63_09160 [Catalimonadaceae bacterium]|nr:hypothetical protein [Catalimonadaceae bacterium]
MTQTKSKKPMVKSVYWLLLFLFFTFHISVLNAQSVKQPFTDFRQIEQTRAFIDERLSKGDVPKAREAYFFIREKLAGYENIQCFNETEHLGLNLIFGNFNEILHYITDPVPVQVQKMPNGDFVYIPESDQLSKFLTDYWKQYHPLIEDSIQKTNFSEEAKEALLLFDQLFHSRYSYNNNRVKSQIKLIRLRHKYPESQFFEALERKYQRIYLPQPFRHEFGISVSSIVPQGPYDVYMSPGVSFGFQARIFYEHWMAEGNIDLGAARVQTPVTIHNFLFEKNRSIGYNNFQLSGGGRIIFSKHFQLTPFTGLALTNVRINRLPQKDSAGKQIDPNKTSVFTGANLVFGFMLTKKLATPPNRYWKNTDWHCDKLIFQDYPASYSLRVAYTPPELFPNQNSFNLGFLWMGLTFELGHAQYRNKVHPKTLSCILSTPE